MSEILSTGISRLGVNAVVVTTVFTVVGIATALLRFHFRGRAALEKDDYVLMVALPFLIAQLIGQYILAFLGGEGYSMQDLNQNPETFTWLFKMMYWPMLGYTTVIVLLKTSILYSYLRIFGHVRSTRYHVYVLLALTWAWGVAIFFACVFRCTPIDKAWIPQKEGYCIDLIPFLWGNSISNCVIDWLILAVPVMPVLRLHLPPTQRFLVGLSFLCGLLACVASTARAAMTVRFDPNDLGVSSYHASIWVFMEPPFATMSCCLPFVTRLFGAKVATEVKKMSKGSGYSKTKDPINSQASPAQEENHLNIHMITTTTVNTRDAGPGQFGGQIGCYQSSITAPGTSYSKSESAKSFV